MSYEQRDNTFSVFKNKRKEEKTHADLTGTGLIDGKEYWVNVWKKTDKNGDTWLSGSIRPKEGKPETYKGGLRQNAIPPSKSADTEDEIPF